MNIDARCDELKREIETNTKRSENIKVRVSPTTKQRLENTANLLIFPKTNLLIICYLGFWYNLLVLFAL